MMLTQNRLVLAALALCLPTAALASADFPVDAAIVEACLQSASAEMRAPDCIGAAAAQCMDLPDGSTTLGMTSCFAAEAAVWNTLMVAELAALEIALQKLDDTRSADYLRVRPLLDKSQSAWMTHRFAQCDLATGIVIDGTNRAPTTGACEVDVMSQRAIDLRLLRATAE